MKLKRIGSREVLLSSQAGRPRITTTPIQPSVGEVVPSFLYASWGRRFLAFVLDYTGFVIAITVVVDHAPSGTEGWLYFLFWPAVIILFGAYFVGFHGGKRGQTLGKRALGIAVRDEEAHGRIGYGRALGRWLTGVFLWSLFGFGLLLDCLWPLWDKRKQALHDKVARSIVVRV